MRITPLSFNNYSRINKNNFKKSNTVSNPVSFKSNLTKKQKAEFKEMSDKMVDVLDMPKVIEQTHLYPQISENDTSAFDNDTCEYKIKKFPVRGAYDEKKVIYFISNNSSYLNNDIKLSTNNIEYYMKNLENNWTCVSYNLQTEKISCSGSKLEDKDVEIFKEMCERIKKYEMSHGNFKI